MTLGFRCDQCGQTSHSFTITGNRLPDPNSTFGERLEIVCVACSAKANQALVVTPVSDGVVGSLPLDVQNELVDTVEALVRELTLIRMKDTNAVYDPTVRTRARAVLHKCGREIP